MTDTVVMPKVYKDKVVVNYGLLSSHGKAYNTKKPNAKKEEKFQMACPIHGQKGEAREVQQRYICIDGPECGTFLPGECLRQKDGVLVDVESIKEAKTSDMPVGVLELRSHPFEPGKTLTSGNVYAFVPDGPDKFYDVLLMLLDERGVVTTDSGPKMLVAECSLRSGSEMFVRLERWGNQLLIREMVRPEDVGEFPDIEHPAEVGLVDMARQLIEAQTEDFDPEEYKASVRDRLAAVVSAAQTGEAPVAVKTKVKKPVQDLGALLEASLAAAKAKKEEQ